MSFPLPSALLPSLAGALALLVPRLASADCAAPQTYTQQVVADSVTICPSIPGGSGLGCPASGGMIRVDTSNGSATKIPDECGSDASANCYVDECVAPGTYQYGYGTPYSCGASCSTDYFVEVNVQFLDGGGCTSDAGTGTDATAPWDGAVPAVDGFGVNPSCNYESPDSGPVDGADASADSGSIDSGVARADASPDTADGGGGGCSVGLLGGTSGTVLMVHGFGLALGLTALSRRRKRK
jgi:hypothetical protein